MFEFLKQLKRNKPMRIVVNGNPALRSISAPIDEITAETRNFAAELTRSLVESETPGVGLAAPQVGVNLRMVVIDTRSDEGPRPDALPGELMLEPQMPVVLINPEIISSSSECECTSEGCLSLPGVSGHVTRPKTVVLKSRMLNGSEFTAECGGLLARCLQHEIDHLDGILFYDRIPQDEQRKGKTQMARLEKRELSLLKIAEKK